MLSLYGPGNLLLQDALPFHAQRRRLFSPPVKTKKTRTTDDSREPEQHCTDTLDTF